MNSGKSTKPSVGHVVQKPYTEMITPGDASHVLGHNIKRENKTQEIRKARGCLKAERKRGKHRVTSLAFNLY